MRTPLLDILILGSACLLASCRVGPDHGPALGSLSAIEAVGVRLAQETRPAIAAAEDGRGSLEVRLTSGSLVLAFGWKARADSRAWAGTTIHATFRGDDGSSHLLAATRLPPAGGGREGWLQTVRPVPEELVGLSGSIVFENGGADDGWSLFTAVPKLVPKRGNRPNIILISIDTLRADRLGCYGHSRPTSPAIDAMARQGTLFRNAF